MKKIYWAFISLLVLGGVGAAVYYGTRPKPIPKIDYSLFETPEKIGEAVAARMQMDLAQSPLIFLGVMPDHPEDVLVWKSFLAKLSGTQSQYSIVVIEPKLPHKSLVTYKEEFDIKDEMSRFVEGIQKVLEQKIRVAVIVPSIYSSQLLKSNPVEKIKTDFKLNPLSYSIAHIPLSREQESTLEIPCNVEQGDYDGTGALGCAIVSKARTVYRKKKIPDRYIGLMDQVGEKDYLVLLGKTEK